MKLALKNKMHNTIKLEMKSKKFFNPPKGNCSAATIIVHYTVDERYMNFLYMFQLGMCLRGKDCHMFLYGCREGCELQLLTKTASSGQTQSYENGTTKLLAILFFET